jgi:hypothetical protein
MRRRWNLFLWTGFFLVLLGVISYVPFFALFPVTRDFPWANLLLCGAGGVLLCAGLLRAFRKPELYRGKVFGPMLTMLSGAAVGLFVYGILFQARQVPASPAAPRIGQKAPDFSLPDQNGKPITLAELLTSPMPGAAATAAPSGVLLIFYRGHW